MQKIPRNLFDHIFLFNDHLTWREVAGKNCDSYWNKKVGHYKVYFSRNFSNLCCLKERRTYNHIPYASPSIFGLLLTVSYQIIDSSDIHIQLRRVEIFNIKRVRVISSISSISLKKQMIKIMRKQMPLDHSLVFYWPLPSSSYYVQEGQAAIASPGHIVFVCGWHKQTKLLSLTGPDICWPKWQLCQVCCWRFNKP